MISVVGMGGHNKQTSNVICYLLMGMSLIGSSLAQTTMIRDVVPNLIWVSTSNQYGNITEPIQNPECTKIQSQGLLVLQCDGSTSILFDRVIGGALSDDEDFLKYYTWQRQLTPRPYVAMNFNPPLEEIHNITLYFYHTGVDIQGSIATNITTCFLRSPAADYNTTEVLQLSDPSIGVVVRPVMLPANTTSVKYLRIDMELLPLHDKHSRDYIFLSEIRVAERLQVVSNVPSSDNDDDSVSVAVISGAVVGTLLLIIIIIVMIVVFITVFYRRKKSRRIHNTVNKVELSEHVPNLQQHTCNISDQLQHDYTSTSQLGVEVEPKSKLETVNALYISSKVKSLDSLLRCYNRRRTDVIGCDVIITPNPSYIAGPNSSETGKECEYQYDYVQTDDGSVQHDKIVGAITSGGKYDEVIDPADSVNIDPNPSYALPQYVKLKDNPSYKQLQL